MESTPGLVICLDPTGYLEVESTSRSPRLSSLKGASVGLISNGQDTSDRFLEQLGAALQQEFGVAKVLVRRKPDLSQPCPEPMMGELLAEVDALITGAGV